MSANLISRTISGESEIPVVVFLNSPDDFTAQASSLQKAVRQAQSHAQLVGYLQRRGEKSTHLTNCIDSLANAGRIKNLKRFWITDAISFTTDSDALNLVASDDEVALVVEDLPLELVVPVATGDTESGLVGSDFSMAQIGVRELWQMGYTGHGRIVCGFDTGVEGSHPALASRWLGNDSNTSSLAWFDPYGTTVPTDLNGHGTHTMGLMTGRDGADTIGVAFNANWMAAAVIDRGQNLSKTVSDILAAFQWAADPDGDPETSADLPDVVCNSWGIPKGLFEACNETFFEAIDNLEALGVVVIFACGNEGPNAGTIRNPADRASSPTNSFSVGAVDQSRADLMIANFSSRGPANCDTTKVKPEIVAPGVSLRSSYKGGTYRLMSGTSMAAPIVAGCVALMREYNPDATVEEIKNALIQSALDLGLAGKDNEYGHGFINVRHALDFLPVPQKPRIQLVDVTIEGEQSILNVGTTTPIHLTVSSPTFPVTNLTGTLRSDNSHVFLLTSTADFGNLPSQMLGDNAGAPYLVKIDHTALPGDAATFTIDFYSQQFGYLNSVDFELTFSQPIVAATDNISTDRLSAEITNYGLSRRYYDYSAGQDLLSHFGLLLTTNEGSVNDAIPGQLDFVATDSIFRLEGPSSTRLACSYHSIDGLQIQQSTTSFVQPGHNNFLIVEYEVASPENSPAIDFAGLSLDFDFTGGESLLRDGDDLVFRSAGYDRYVGVRAISTVSVIAASFSGAEAKSGMMSDESKLQLLASRADLDLSEGDQAAIFGLNLIDYPMNNEMTAAFVIATGNSLDEISVALQAGELSYLQATDAEDDNEVLPTSFALNQNFPNPFNAETQISFYLPSSGSYSLEVINSLGQSVRRFVADQAAAGAQSLTWDGKDDRGADVATGVYFYRLTFDGNSTTRKMVLLK